MSQNALHCRVVITTQHTPILEETQVRYNMTKNIMSTPMFSSDRVTLDTRGGGRVG